MNTEITWSQQTHHLIAAAIDEDLGQFGDVTAALLPDPVREAEARIVSRADGVVAGLALAPHICSAFTQRLGATVRLAPATSVGSVVEIVDGDHVTGGQTLGTLCGPSAAVLTTERTLLNFLGRMSGVASLTQRFVRAAEAVSSRVRILDTRKTLPGWRELDKYAVRIGGGHNHRIGLHDAVLIKDNHLAGIPTEHLARELPKLLDRLSPGISVEFVEVEVDDCEQFEQVCRVDRVNIALLDNFTPEMIRRAVEIRASAGREGSLELEASGGVSLETVAAIAATGIDRISIGALTHSARSLDIGLDL